MQSERANLTILFDKYLPVCLDTLRTRYHYRALVSPLVRAGSHSPPPRPAVLQGWPGSFLSPGALGVTASSSRELWGEGAAGTPAHPWV